MNEGQAWLGSRDRLCCELSPLNWFPFLLHLLLILQLLQL